MASNIPQQQRTIDPFASYNSNAVNQMTRVVTHGQDGLLTPNSLQVNQVDVGDPVYDSDYVVVVSPGFVMKDDVLIQITQEHHIDFRDVDQYFLPGGVLPQEGGYHYIVLQYRYEKSKPPPQASIKILKPGERHLLYDESELLLLKVVRLENVSPHIIESVHDFDPQNPDNQRKYIKLYGGAVTTLPEFDLDRDLGRLVYVTETNEYYFGYSSGWGELASGGVSFDINNIGVGVEPGMLCYLNGSGDAVPAISTDITTCSDFFVVALPEGINPGKSVLAGFVEGALVQSDDVIEIGDIVYLSATEPGKITRVKPNGVYQMVGRSLSNGNVDFPIDMIYSPKLPLNLSIQGQITTWTSISDYYYYDIDTSTLGGKDAFLTAWYDNSDLKEIVPRDVQILNDGDTVRVSVNNNTLVLNYIISVGGGSGDSNGGGGGGTTNHALLSNLSYATSGHIGFAPSPHNNSHHSEIYITASGVNFTNLNNNGSVGTGISQVAQGNHTHIGLVDIPSGSTILFESNTAIPGYTLLNTQDDMVVYITKGSAAGGENGGALKSGGTWTQPNHTHGINNQADHDHTTGNHALTIAQMPVHNHSVTYRQTTWGGGGDPGDFWVRTSSSTTGNAGSGQAHNHGNTGNNGSHDHGGNTIGNATINTWRPRGLNFTRQQRV